MGYPVTDFDPQVTMPNGMQIALKFLRNPLGDEGLNVCWRYSKDAEWLGAEVLRTIDGNGGSSIYGSHENWNKFLAAAPAAIQSTLATIYHPLPIVPIDGTPTDINSAEAWLVENVKAVVNPDGTFGLATK
jgi:hypothetical protein